MVLFIKVGDNRNLTPRQKNNNKNKYFIYFMFKLMMNVVYDLYFYKKVSQGGDITDLTS